MATIRVSTLESPHFWQIAELEAELEDLHQKYGVENVELTKQASFIEPSLN